MIVQVGGNTVTIQVQSSGLGAALALNRDMAEQVAAAAASATAAGIDAAAADADRIDAAASAAAAAATLAGAALKASNLSDMASASTALSNIGGAAKSANLSDLASAATARTNLGGTTTGVAVFTAADTPAARLAIGSYPTANAQQGSGTAVAKLNGAITAAGTGIQVWNPSELNVGTEAPTNNVGALVEGVPVYYEPATLGSAGRDGGRRVWNLPGRDGATFGQEYLFVRWGRTLEVNGVGNVVVLVSDSTGIGYQGVAFQALMEENPNVVFYNYSKSGATLEQWVNGTGPYAASSMALSDVMALDPNLLIVGFDTNASYVDGSTVQEVLDARRAAYTTIRAHANGSIQEMSLVTLGLASMNDTAAGLGPEPRDQLYAHKVTQGLRAICTEFQSAFFSQYELYPDAAWTDFGGGTYQDSVLDAARVHPLNAYQTCLAQDLFEFIVPSAYRSLFDGNAATDLRINVTAGSGFALPANDEATWTRRENFIVQAGGYMTMNTPAALTMGTVLATITTDHRPRKNAYRQATAVVWAGTAVDNNTSWEELPCNVKTDGSVVVIKTGAMTPTRIWFYGNWEANV